MLKALKKSLFLALFCAFFAQNSAFAADGATILFRDGVVAELRDGYKQLMDGMRDRAKGRDDGPVIEINLDGNSFFVDLGQVVTVCKQPCRSFRVLQKEKK